MDFDSLARHSACLSVGNAKPVRKRLVVALFQPAANKQLVAERKAPNKIVKISFLDRFNSILFYNENRRALITPNF